MHLQGALERTTTASLIKARNLSGTLGNPHPPRCEISLQTRLHASLCYLLACIPHPGHDETPKSFRRRIYTTLHTMATAATAVRDIRVTKLHPTFNWPQVWRNLHAACITEEVKPVWFTAIPDIIPMNERLSKIRITDSNRCIHCGHIDTLLRSATKEKTYGNGSVPVLQ